MQTKWAARGLVIGAALLPLCALAQGLPALTSTPTANGGQNYTLSLQTMLLLTGLTFIPAALLMMTSFTCIIIVLSLLRQAPDTQALFRTIRQRQQEAGQPVAAAARP